MVFYCHKLHLISFKNPVFIAILIQLLCLHYVYFFCRSIPVPILMRHDSFEDGVLKEKVLIGHPGLLKLPSTLPAAKLYEHVDNAIPFLSTYSLLLVDNLVKIIIFILLCFTQLYVVVCFFSMGINLRISRVLENKI